ncbi:transcription termination factor MTERF15, mitochondrial-like [Tasmannia lanceolata]|uniref:transcription termination factor MTERF15, mitochondrial-like n=1 Tax=Tasmannia lanceolata TaxID=3420 RepID=UPI004064C712
MLQFLRRKLFYLYSFQNPSLKSISQLSNSTNQPSFKVSYLINSCGPSKEAALKVAQKINFETAEKPDCVLAFFRNHDLTKTHISNIITKCPQLLVYNPDKTLKPKFEFFLGLGISAPDLAKTLHLNPYILARSLENQIIPTFDFLKSVLHPNEGIIVALRQLPFLIQFNVPKVLEPNVKTLRNHGVPGSRISTLSMTNPRTLGIKSDRFSGIVTAVKEMGFDPSGSLFIAAVIAMAVLSKSTWAGKLEVYRSLGWTDDEILSAFKKQPWYMTTSEQKVRRVMDFFVNRLDQKPSFLSKHPNFLLLSLEKRIRPRCSVLQVLMSKGILRKDLKLSTVLPLTEKKFMEKYVTKNKESVPEILSVYQGKTRVTGLDIGSQESDAVQKL